LLSTVSLLWWVAALGLSVLRCLAITAAVLASCWRGRSLWFFVFGIVGRVDRSEHDFGDLEEKLE
jgi:hypothetical protein